MEDETMPIAIVGLSCRLPGAASCTDNLWRMCAEKHDVWQPIPKERMNNGAFYHPDPNRNGTSNVLGGHFLNDDPGLFDASFFNLTGVEARAMDPQQRILLELSYEALENGGITLEKVAKSDTAVFVGSSCRDYADLLQRDTEKTELFQSTGTGQTMLSNRISYFYDLKGPSVTVDTACSSSLVALHLACNALRVGEASMAIVGGANLILSHEPMLALSMLRFLSPDGRCYPYDERANGFGRGEGAACLVLKPFHTALQDGDTVRGVVRNSGTNQDGKTNGISLPSGDAQVELMERTYRAAGLDPAHTSYVESHGTVTPVGDPIEAASLSRVFSKQRPLDRPLQVGSLKSNIGHLEGASGVASMVKTVLMLENNLILPNLNFQKANTRIPMHEWKINVPTSVECWPAENVHRASINNFGFGGSNAHVILDDAHGYMASRGLAGKYKQSMTLPDTANCLRSEDAGPGTRPESRVFPLSSFTVDEGRVDGPLLSEKEWDDVLHATGFNRASAIVWDMPDPESHHSSTIVSTTPVKTRERWPAFTIVTDAEGSEPWLEHLEFLLARAGIEYNAASLTECDPRNRICIVLCELTRPLLRNPSPIDYASIKRIFLEGGGVLWLTHGALMESSNPDLNLVTGLARTVRVENGDTTIVMLDVDARHPLSGPSMAEKIFQVLVTSFGEDGVGATEMETEYVERDGTIMIPRIIEDNRMDPYLDTSTGTSVLKHRPYLQEGRPLKAEIQTPGLLDSIQFVDDESISGGLPDDFVEVEVKASGINFRDVMTALGQISAYPLGCEFSGIVSAVGRLVRDIKPGDHVIATVKNGCFRNTVRAPAEEVELFPQTIPFEVVAALPVAYFTAYWAVFKVARLRKDESVLIHAGSGGLGQAIINLCQLVGAKIFATVGTLAKKRLLMTDYNIPEANIFSSRDGTFYKGIMAKTEGRGIDVIMNSLSGEALRLTWNCIAPFGRFVELGKRDFTINSRLEMRHFEKNVSFVGLDVPLGSQHGEKKKVWSEIMALYAAGSIKAPSPITVFGVSELERALRTMQSGRHMGKMVLKPQPDEMVKVVHLKKTTRLLRDDASYLLIGGLGGIGRATASWMSENGARNFIFASPSGSEKQKAKETIALLEDQGARVSAFKCDVSNLEDLDRVLENSSRDMPPIRGLLHGALVSKADLLARMSLQDYNDVMRPKVDGIWNLHSRLSKVDLDFFIMLSSVVGLAGDPSQAAYVAASVFEDAFADFRNRQGLPAVTLDLGKVVDIGIVAERFSARRGVRGLWSRDLHEEEVTATIKSAIIQPLRMNGPGSSIIGLKAWSPAADPVFQAPLFSHFRRAAMNGPRKSDQEGVTGPRIRGILRHAKSLDDAARKACKELISKTSSLLMMPAEDLDPSKSMAEYGMDSLVAVEMRNWLLRELDCAMPILELMGSVSLLDLSVKVVKKSKLVSPSILAGGTMER